MTSYRLMDGADGRPGVGSGGTQPPAAATGYSGSYIAGLVFSVSEVLWLEGYWWWVPSENGNTGAQKCALWQVTSSSGGSLVSTATVESGTLIAGWNWIPLDTPVALTPAFPYLAATGFTSAEPAGFPATLNQFGASDPYVGGFSNGPLSAYATGAALAFNVPQSPYSISGADPTATFPHSNDENDLLWLDVQVSTQAPAGTSYRGFPSAPGGFGGTAQDLAYTIGVEFSLSEPCRLDLIWHYSPPTATVLPTRCAIWVVSTETELAGSDNESPAWSGSAGSGWISCDYTDADVILQPDTNYKVSTFTADNTDVWFAASADFWGTGDLWAAGIVNGPLTLPGNAAASAPGQDSWHEGTTWTYPATSSNPEYDGVDIEVTPVNLSASGLLMAAGII